jgi:plasmid stabilization system protein ParE
MRLSFTPSARRDLQEIGDFIAKDSRRQARRLISEIESLCGRLRRMPERYPVLAPYQSRAIRRAPFGAYGIYYRCDLGEIVVLRILHAARDVEDLLGRL